MPIIDDENQLYDLGLSKKFNSHFGNSADGRLIDNFVIIGMSRRNMNCQILFLY